jgi:peptidoglycan/LPS O-acetylase OafA/YrhL
MGSSLMFTYFQGPSAGEKLDQFGGIGPGFDFWRFLLSTLIIFLHTFFVCYGRHAEISVNVGTAAIVRPIWLAVLPVFFGLSGFLVAGSALRTNSIAVFLTFRGLRLVPALAVETTLAALILGPLVTTVSLSEYFTQKEFFAYFGNIVGRVRFQLPGVFESSPEPGLVNINLWTLHAELECYALMAAAIISGLLHRRMIALSLWVLGTICLAILNASVGMFEPTNLYPTSVFTYSFCTGVVAFLWRDKISINRNLFGVVTAAYCLLVFLPQTVFVAIPLLMYVMIYVGLAPQLNFRFLSKGDYSYGMYLYSFVVQQSLSTTFPRARHWWIIFPLSLAVTVVISVVSWHTIEHPALGLKRLFLRRPVNGVGKQIAPAS